MLKGDSFDLSAYPTFFKLFKARLATETSKSSRLKKREAIPKDERKVGAAVQLRSGFAEEYEGPVSDRESWWRAEIKETPFPTRYPIEDYNFLMDMDKKYATSIFKSSGRRKPPYFLTQSKGDALLPGATNQKDFLYELRKQPKYYNFKAEGRNKKDMLNFGKKDKDVNVPPNLYHREKYDCVAEGTVKGSKNASFKSQVRRFPTIHFVPKDGPSPGEYESKAIMQPGAVSACFKSKTPRFDTSHTKVPGPGHYHHTYRPQCPNILKLGEYGLFFTPEYNHLLQIL